MSSLSPDALDEQTARFLGWDRSARRAIERLLPMFIGRLEDVGLSKKELRKLKRELQNYDARTGQWKE